VTRTGAVAHLPYHDDIDLLGDEIETPPRPDAGFVGEDEQFHTRLLAAAGNHILVQALEQVNVRIRPVRMFDYLTEDRMKATIEEHIAIAEAAYDNNLVQAREALLAHIEESRRVAVERASAALSMADIVMALQK
jgi:DNA-binding GntR family transcriptional regulator